jgi:hypothetical protein
VNPSKETSTLVHIPHEYSRLYSKPIGSQQMTLGSFSSSLIKVSELRISYNAHCIWHPRDDSNIHVSS